MAKRVAGGRAGKRSASGAGRGKGSAWHTPSFLIGALGGLAGGLAVTQAPSYLAEQVGSLPAAAPLLPSGETEGLTFRFDDLLKNSEVPANPERYGPGAPADAPSPASAAAAAPDQAQLPRRQPVQPQAFHIQAASFRRPEDAEQLRARLMLQALPAATARVEIDSGAWHRVTVGPIDSAEEAKRIMNLLREQDLSAMWIKRS